MLTCKDITQKATDYNDKHMGLWQRMQFKMHVLMCHHCRRFMHQFERTIEMTQQLKPSVPCSDSSIDEQVKRLMNINHKP
ncbi:MAG: hypothetical protein OEZ58_16415 [Gammaproteobacteria bacterium]|nr:hypothetical protein [Gammaproteobacteria bacterium]MDH5730576.1 hypothetical protein [Gammaproteobacteria bacterium]